MARESDSDQDASFETAYYSGEDVRRIAAALDRDSLPPAIVVRLEEAAHGYQFASMVDREPSRAARRASLQRIAKLASELSRELTDLDALTSQGLRDPLIPDYMSLEILDESAKQLRDTIPERGGDPKLARRHFVADLADIYRDVMGEEPTRRHNAGNEKDYGPFLEFARAALEPFAASASIGVEHDSRAVMKARTSR